MSALKKIPFFIFLLPLFFCLHGSAENFGFLSFKEVFFPGLYILAGMVLSVGVCWSFTRNWLHAALLVFFTALWYLFFGALHDWVKATAALAFVKSYKAMVIVLFLVSTAWMLLLKYKKALHGKLALYINSLLLIYCLIDIFSLCRMQFVKPSEKTLPAIPFNAAAVAKKPDIYFLLFDGYPGKTSLQDSFNFSNDSLQQYFTARAFKALPMRANYDLTYFCMSSVFNMQYVKDDFDDLHLTQRDFQKRGVEINQAAVFSMFKSLGYQLNNCSIFEVDGQPPLSGLNDFLLAHSILITDKIFHNRLKRDLGNSLAAIIPFWKNPDFQQHDTDNKKAEKLLLEIAAKKQDKPQLVYAHFMMPHGPYYFDSLGRKNPLEKIANYTQWENKQLFVSYLKYVNNRMMNMVDSIIKQKPGAIVLVMGDHGFRSYNAESLQQTARFDILCMARFPDTQYDTLPQKASAVNLFRYLLNNQFNQKIVYLPDSSITLRY